jgi:hypothetical protein
MAPKLTLVTAPFPILCQLSRFAELKRWQPQLFTLSRTTTSTTGSYAPALGRNSATPTREAAERAAQAIAQEREAELVVHLPDGKTGRTHFAKSWAARLFRR